MYYKQPSILTRLRKGLVNTTVSCKDLGHNTQTGRTDRIFTVKRKPTVNVDSFDSFLNDLKDGVKDIFHDDYIVNVIESEDSKEFKVKFSLEQNRELVESVNLMSGKKIMIEKHLKGGCCDPGTEQYWSM